MTFWSVIGMLSFGIWLYLLLGRGHFWRERIQPAAPEPERWPEVVAIVPARNEAAFIGASIRSLLTQEYPGRFSVLLVDDQSDDGTAERARAAAEIGAPQRLTVLKARALPDGWTGKLWALDRGLAEVARRDAPPDLILLTDADIVHHARNLRELVARIESGGYDLASLMVKLRCESFAERFLIPAFVFFFEMLYPFAWVRDPRNRTAGAAGGCVLVRRDALRRIGGLAAIRGAIIDDCALARAVKQGGPIWLGLTEETRSLRPYPTVAHIWRMVARTAFAQLRYSPALLLGTVAGLAVTYLAPVAVALSGSEAVPLGLATWAAMALAFLPTLRLYGLSPAWAPLLPVIALVYMAATVDSARRHWQGRGGEWKGRVQRRSRA